MNSNTPKLNYKRLIDGDVQMTTMLQEVINTFDLLSNLSFISKTTMVQPTTILSGSIYFIPAGATGSDWGNFNDHIAITLPFRTVFIPIFDGCRGWFEDDNEFAVYSDSAWRVPGIIRKSAVTLESPVLHTQLRKTLFKAESAASILDVRANIATVFSITVGYSPTWEGAATNIATVFVADGQSLVGTLLATAIPAGSYVWFINNAWSAPFGSMTLQISYTEAI